MDLGLKGKRVVITGASQGIGEGLATAFAEEAANLHLIARSGEALAAIADRIKRAHGVDVRTQTLDLTAPGAIDQVAEAAADVDVLVNNAGAIPGGAWFKGGLHAKAG
jgi:short-subunit dehydrogenase